MDDCIFCRIIKKEIPSEVVYDDPEILAIKDIKPKAPIHILVIPKKHIKNLSAMNETDIELVGKINFIAAKIAAENGAKDRFKLTTNSGEFAGQVIMHLHYHLLAGWAKREDVVSELHK